MAQQEISRSAEVAADPQRVWQLVTDLPGMGARSPENTGGRWAGGATGPTLGAQFAGTNRNGLRRWSTVSTVTTCEPERAFAFEVKAGGMRVSRWSYELQPTATGCRVTETWTDLRGLPIAVIGRVVSGVRDREAFTAASIEQTLAALAREAAAG